MLLPVFAFAAVFRLLAGPATFSPVPAVAVVSGYLDHPLSGDSVRLYYGRHYSSDRITAALSPAGDFEVVLNDLKAGTPIMFKYVGQ